MDKKVTEIEIKKEVKQRQQGNERNESKKEWKE